MKIKYGHFSKITRGNFHGPFLKKRANNRYQDWTERKKVEFTIGGYQLNDWIFDTVTLIHISLYLTYRSNGLRNIVFISIDKTMYAATVSPKTGN